MHYSSILKYICIVDTIDNKESTTALYTALHVYCGYYR